MKGVKNADRHIQTGGSQVNTIQDDGELPPPPASRENGNARMKFSVAPKVVGIWVRKQSQIPAPTVRFLPGGERVRREEAQRLWDTLPDSVTTKDGRNILIKNTAQGTVETTLEHLITSHSKDRTWVDARRIASLNRIPLTISNAGMRLYSKNGNHIYIQPYSDGLNHYVVVSPDQIVLDEGYGDVLKTQWMRSAKDDEYLEAEYVLPITSS